MKLFYVKYSLVSGQSGKRIIPARDGFEAVSNLLKQSGYSFRMLDSVLSVPVNVA